LIDFSVFARPRRSRVVHADAREMLSHVEPGSVQCICTSPPYFGLRDYGGPELSWADGWVGQLGLEPTPDMYVEHLHEVFAAAREALRDDGLLFLNIGDSYAGSWGNQGRKAERGTQRPINGGMLTPVLNGCYPDAGSNTGTIPPGADYKAKDLLGIPWMTAFAMRTAGWYLRSAIVWEKPNAMPSSVRDRPTSSYEHVFMLSKKPRYHYDQEAVKVPVAEATKGRSKRSRKARSYDLTTGQVGPDVGGGKEIETRNLRDVWSIPTKGIREAHFAVFPQALAERCLLAGTSPIACGACGAPWRRIVERTAMVVRESPTRQAQKDASVGANKNTSVSGTMISPPTSSTKGFEPTCGHDDPTGRCLVMDPFSGASTTGLACASLGLDYVGFEVVEEYIEIGERRMSKQA
jgi:DNA modification methylase